MHNLFTLLLITASATAATTATAHANSLALSLRQNIAELVFTDPAAFRDQAYCYFVYQGVIKPNDLSPSQFSKYVKGSSLSNAALPDYNKWLATKEGTACKKIVGKNFKPLASDTSKTHTIFLNRKAIEADGESVDKTLNHERLHVVFAQHKAERKKILDKWTGLSKEDQEAFKAKHPGYDYSNQDVLLREFFSYTYEQMPEEALQLLQGQ